MNIPSADTAKAEIGTHLSGCSPSTPEKEHLFDVLGQTNETQNQTMNLLRMVIARIEGPEPESPNKAQNVIAPGVVGQAFEARTKAQIIQSMAERIARAL
jgi:hypothetical protein